MRTLNLLVGASILALILSLPAHGQVIIGGGGSGGVTSFSGDTTGLTPATPTTGAVVLGGTLTAANGGTGINSLGTGVAAALGQAVSGTGSICLSSGSACVTSGTVTSITAGNGISLSTNPCTTTCTASTLITLNNQTGTTYALASTDGGKIVLGRNASSQAYSIVQANTAGFTSGYGTTVSNIGAGTITITAATSVFGNGMTTLAVAPGQVADIGSNSTDYPFTAMSLPKMAQDTVLGNPAAANYPVAMTIPSCANDGAHGLVYASHAFACASITAGTGTVNAGTTPGIAYYATSGSAVSDGSAALVGMGGFNVNSGSAGVTNGMQLVSASHPGIYASGTNIVDISSAGGVIWKKTQLDTNAGGYELIDGATSGTAPNIVPNRSSATTGIGAQASGNMSLVAGGTEITRITSTGPLQVTLPTDATHTDAALCRDTTSGAMLTGTGTAGICLGTSSRSSKIPDSIVPIAVSLAKSDAIAILQWRYGLKFGDPKRLHYSPIADDVCKQYADLCVRKPDGSISSFDWPSLMWIMLEKHRKEIAVLGAENARLHATNDTLRAQEASFGLRLNALEHRGMRTAGIKFASRR